MTKEISGWRKSSIDLPSEQRSVLLESVVLEGVRQARQSADRAHWSFWIATFMTTASTLLGLGGSGLLMMGKASEGAVTTAAGLASGVCSLQLAKEAADRQKQANEWLDEMLRELRNTEDQNKLRR
jgi:hypothetical protein